MDFNIDFVSVGNADAIIVWIKNNGNDIIIFIDGGKTGDSETVIKHYNDFIRLNVSNPILGVINSHPHADHINGLLEIVDYFGNQIKFAVYNDPLQYISQQQRDQILYYHQKNTDPDINHLYELFETIEKLNSQCRRYNIQKHNAVSDLNQNYSGLFKIVSPSLSFYKDKVRYFSDIDILLKNDYSRRGDAEVNEIEEGLKACTVVDEKNDASPENLTSTVIELTDSQGRRYLLTGDAGVDSFNSAEATGFNLSNYLLVQLPHHGSRRNVNTNWLCRFNPSFYVVSAEGTKKHPRKAVISCIKKNLPNCRTYGTHKGGTLSYCSNPTLFPNRGWGNPEPL